MMFLTVMIPISLVRCLLKAAAEAVLGKLEADADEEEEALDEVEEALDELEEITDLVTVAKIVGDESDEKKTTDLLVNYSSILESF